MGGQKPGCLLVLLRLFGAPSSGAESLPYRLADQFLTKAEVSFYHVLRIAAGADMAICPKVRVADVVSVTASGGEWQSAFNKISPKHVDFLLCDSRTMEPVLAIELDDSSHKAADRVRRDEFVSEVYEAAGLPVLHMSVRRAYNPQEIAAAIKQAVAGDSPQAELQSGPQADVNSQTGPADSTDNAPICPTCGVPMVLRSAGKGKHKGRSFYGCPNFPRCRQILPAPVGRVEQEGEGQ